MDDNGRGPTAVAKTMRWALGILLMLVSAWASAKPFVMTCQFENYTPIYQELTELYRLAFESLDYQLTIKPLTNQRAISDVARGHADANCLRTEILVQSGPHANLILVPVPLLQFDFEVWFSGESEATKRLQTVIAQGGLVGYERGAWIVHLKLSAQVPDDQIVAVTGTRNGIEMLAADRIQAFVHNASKVGEVLSAMPVPHALTRGEVLVSAHMYPVLNERHRALKAPLANALQAQLARRCAATGAANWPHLCAFYYSQQSASVAN